MKKIPTPKFISKYKERITSSARTIGELMAVVQQNDRTIFKYENEYYVVEKVNLNTPPTKEKGEPNGK